MVKAQHRRQATTERVMTVKIKGPWDRRAIDDYLGAAHFPLRLACVGDDGFPRVVSVWYHYDDGALYCVSHRDSLLVTLLAKMPKVGFEVAPNEPPYRGVRGRGLAAVAPEGGGEMLERLLRHYLGSTESSLAQWLLSRAEDELLITLRPQHLFSWDYTERMS
ncbi:MAG: pyridoxamine 5'-phosphate oxidase [Halioglobus sp.]|nr:pyridoxamine 5'-phosphate oxidase [Halioglobus sp.]